MRRLAFTLAAFALGACGLSVVGTATENAVAVPEAETGVTEDALVPPPPPIAEGGTEGVLDASADADADADASRPIDRDAGDGCTWLVNETFASEPDPKDWLGVSASGWRGANGGEFVLTLPGENTGALWYRHRLSFTGRLHAYVDFGVEGTPQGGGISLNWNRDEQLTVGSGGYSMGVCDGTPKIFAVAAQYRHDGRVDSIEGTDGFCDTAPGDAFKTPVVARTLELLVTGIQVTARVGDQTDDPGQPSGGIHKTGFIGVSSASGAGAGMSVRAFRVKACP